MELWLRIFWALVKYYGNKHSVKNPVIISLSKQKHLLL